MTPSLSPQLAPEERLIILAARIDQDPEQRVETETLLGQNLDWQVVMRRSQLLGVHSLLYRHLSQDHCNRLLPDEVLRELEKSYRNQLIRNLFIYGQIDRILDSIARTDMPLVLLKGSFLAKWLYGDIALRPMMDIDLFCREENWKTIRDGLTALGFSQGVSKSALHERAHAHPPEFLNPKKCRVEVHLNIFFPAPYNESRMDEVWKETWPIETNGHCLRGLAPEDQLLNLSTHLCHHIQLGSIVFYWFCDIHEVIRHYDDNQIDWDRFAAKARSLELGGQVASLLDLLRVHWNTPVPEGVLSSLDKHPKRLCLASMIRIQSDVAFEKKRALRIYLWSLNRVTGIKGARGRIHFLVRQLFPTREYLTRQYDIDSAFMVYPYYAYRLLKICKRAVESGFYNLASIFKNEK